MNLRTLLSALIVLFLLPLWPAFGHASDASKPELVILNWADYIDPDLISAFEKKHGAKVRVINFEDDDNRDQLLLATNGAGYDIVVINETHIPLYFSHGWLAKITPDEVPSLKHVEPSWLEKVEHAQGNAVPYFWGTLGIAYRRDLVKKKPEHWSDLFLPAPDLRGHIAMLSSQREILGMALKAAGHSVNSTDHGEIDEAIKILVAQKPFVRAYQQSLLNEKSELVTGEVSMRMMFNGDALLLHKFNSNIDYVVPSEGAALWVDYMTVMANAPNRKLAYAFLDFINEPDNASRNAAFVNFATPNAAAAKLMPPEFLNNTSIYPSAKTLANSELFVPLPPRALSYRNTQFSRLLQN
ncbi:MAG: spermidine/putrescine ABC transporter substrate-binding protein [Proteobacteria bacterium]|nr:spermidine/putrescine ABC transporter substrate-binding protein [Pseudomonadota bacterium]